MCLFVTNNIFEWLSAELFLSSVMSVNLFAESAPDGSCNYCGNIRLCNKDDPALENAIKEISLVSGIVGTLSKGTIECEWSKLKSNMSRFATFLLSEDSKVHQYQVSLLMDGILPYLKKMNSRFHIDSARFVQFNAIISLIQTGGNDCLQVLTNIEAVICDIEKNQSYLWKSDLASKLQAAIEKQWSPIVREHRAVYRSLGSKVLILGLVCIVGWPLALLYPIYQLVLDILKIQSTWKQSRQINRSNLFSIVKTIIFLSTAVQLVNIMQAYSAFGHTSMIVGIIFLLISMNDKFIKSFAPIMGPHMHEMHQLDRYVRTLQFGNIGQFQRELPHQVDPLNDHMNVDNIDCQNEENKILPDTFDFIDASLFTGVGLRKRTIGRPHI